LKRNVPKNLDECLEQLKKDTPKKELEKFKNLSETDVCLYHHGCGTNMRNSWGLWSKTSPLVKYFNSISIFHADDMSSIIFKSFHRYLNDTDLKLDEQVKFYQDYWRAEGFKDGNPLNDSKDNYRKPKNIRTVNVGKYTLEVHDGGRIKKSKEEKANS